MCAVIVLTGVQTQAVKSVIHKLGNAYMAVNQVDMGGIVISTAVPHVIEAFVIILQEPASKVAILLFTVDKLARISVMNAVRSVRGVSTATKCALLIAANRQMTVLIYVIVRMALAFTVAFLTHNGEAIAQISVPATARVLHVSKIPESALTDVNQDGMVINAASTFKRLNN